MSQARLFPWLQQNTYQPAEEHLNLASLRQVIYPVAAWVVISDFYWEAESPIASQLAHFVREADEGWRWVILINLNSWPYECNLLTGGSGDPSWNIEGPGLTPQDHVEIDNSHLLNDVKDRIEVAQKNFLKQAHRKVFDSIWNWGINPEILPENAFHQCFEQDKHLKQLFEMPS
jgi:hypothetical protein